MFLQGGRKKNLSGTCPFFLHAECEIFWAGWGEQG